MALSTCFYPRLPSLLPSRPGLLSHANPPPFAPSFSSSLSFCCVVSAVVFLASRQSLHLLLIHWCSQMPPPPQSLHLLLCRWCSQMLPPPQSLHWLLSRWCSQKRPPPQSLHWLLTRWCSQMPLPPQSLHLLLLRWCSQSFSPVRRFLGAEGSSVWAGAFPDDVFDALGSAACAFLRRLPTGPSMPSAR